MVSPSGSTNTTSTARPGVPRNKSSSALSSHGASFRTKRNKSSSSLSHGHHNVQFTHHGKKKRTGSSSGGRKNAVEFGFTSMKTEGAEEERDDDDDEDGDDDDEERHGRPKLDQRRSSSASSVATLQASERGRSTSKTAERIPPPVAEAPIETPNETPTPSPPPPPQVLKRPTERSKSRGERERNKLAKVHAPSTSVTETSDWESATDSPLAIGRTLPAASLSVEGASGLGLVMEAGDAVVGEEKKAELEEEEQKKVQGEQEERSTTPTPVGELKTKGKATFRIDAYADDEDVDMPPSPPPSPPREQSRLPANAVTHVSTPPPPPPAAASPQTQQPEQTGAILSESPKLLQSTPPSLSAPVVGAVQPSTPTPPSHTPPTPPKSKPSLDNSNGQNAVAFPSQTRASPESPQIRHRLPHRPATRKVSNASLISMASNRSYSGSLAGLMGGLPGLRRSTSGAVAPIVDRDVARGEVVGSGSSIHGSPEQRRRHKRHMSDASVRSLLTVAETAGSRPSARKLTSKLITPDGREYEGTMPPSRSSTASSSSALASLGSLGVRTRTTSASSLASTSQKRNSGYFSSLRGLTGLQGFTMPPSPTAASTTPVSKPTNAVTMSSSLAKGKAKASPPLAGGQHHPLISKFVEPTQIEQQLPLSISPALPSRAAAFGGRNNSSASLSTGGGAMSRTQQKALLARDAPYWANGSGPTRDDLPPSLAASGYYSQLPLAPPGGPQSGKMVRGGPGGGMEARQGMHKWAMGLVREAERIERQFRAVEKWRDPLGESLERVLGTGTEQAGAARVKA